MAHVRFECLPAEILEHVASILDLSDLRNLRLTSIEVSARVSGAHFRSLFRHKMVNIASQSRLDEFIHMTRPGELGRVVQNLTLRGILPAADGHTNPEKPEGVAERLAIALNNIRDNSATGRLACLSIDAARVDLPVRITGETYDDFDSRDNQSWRSTWRAAQWTFKEVCSALAISDLPIERLDVFSQVFHCSLAVDGLKPALDAGDLSVPLAGLKALSLSLSDRLGSDSEENEWQQVCRLLELCPRLESLELHWYNTSAAGLGSTGSDVQFFNRIADQIRLPHLRSLSLRGISFSESPFLSLISHTGPITSLKIENCRLLSGSYAHIFPTTVPALGHLHLDVLWTPEGPLQFSGPGLPHFYTSDGNSDMPLRLMREGDAARQPVEFSIARGRMADSVGCNRWFKWLDLHYGPPDRGRSHLMYHEPARSETGWWIAEEQQLLQEQERLDEQQRRLDEKKQTMQRKGRWQQRQTLMSYEQKKVMTDLRQLIPQRERITLGMQHIERMRQKQRFEEELRRPGLPLWKAQEMRVEQRQNEYREKDRELQDAQGRIEQAELQRREQMRTLQSRAGFMPAVV
ncbi:hypothetical protein ANO11243_056630 [Dothideomycetidae sp. 11243]|nr:hypothetical protein ANO11243_056630 [fungal sp. No.11243]